MIVGSTISHYQIVEKLGEGGMGVVYKAEDTTLERAVALKFLADHLLNDEEAKERFLREAKAAAALHHPNICPVYEIAEADGKTFIAMAFLEGDTLEDRIAEGPLSIKDALDIARQVAEGLQAAHSKGVFHRDIKPANIIVSPEGRPTIMDFGLARLTEASRLTKVDTAMGTVAYMSPEQGQGMEVDSRTDIWALGCVLYEMVSGQRPFQGQYDQALLYEIVHEEPAALTGLRTGVPVELEILASKCLEKDRDDRYGTAQEVARDVRTLAERLKSGRSTVLQTGQMTGAVPATMAAAHTANPAEPLPPDAMVVKRSSQRLLQGLAASCAVAFLGILAFNLTGPPPEQLTRRFSFSQEGLSSASISPNGRYIAFAADTRDESGLWLRSIGSETARKIPGTEDARAALAWSPDSQSIVFATTAQAKRVAIDGGDPVTLGDLPGRGGQGFMGVSWSPDGQRIVFSSTGRLFEVPALGGEPQVLVGRDLGSVWQPHFLPTDSGPEALVYEARSRIWVLNLETNERTEIGRGSAPVYAPEGYLIHGSGNTGETGLRALPFSRASLEPTGEAFPIAEDGQFASVAGDGTLVFLDGASAPFQSLGWRNRVGEALETIGQPQPGMWEPVLSPDGQQIAVRSFESGQNDIWIHDLIRSTKTRLQFDGLAAFQPTWSSSGEEIVFSLERTDGMSLMRTVADGTGEADVLAESDGTLWISDWSQDGRFLIYSDGGNSESDHDIFYLELTADDSALEPEMFLGTPATEFTAKFSPDGRFVAYTSDESGRTEIYVRPFPDGAGKWQVSVNGGMQPRWRGDGKELYYVEGTNMMAVSVSTEPTFTLGQPQRLFESDNLGMPDWEVSYDVSADGERFVTVAPVEDIDEEAAPPKIRIVQNWYEEFRDREQ